MGSEEEVLDKDKEAEVAIVDSVAVDQAVPVQVVADKAEAIKVVAVEVSKDQRTLRLDLVTPATSSAIQSAATH